MKHEHVVQYSVAKDSDLRLKQHVHGDVSKVELEKVGCVLSNQWPGAKQIITATYPAVGGPGIR